MTAQWKQFTGSEEQISEILNAKDGFKIKHENGDVLSSENKFSWDFQNESVETRIWILNQIKELKSIAEYMICQPHPHADMIIEWARTGREVYRLHLLNEFDKGVWVVDTHPKWTPYSKYSFDPSKTSLPCDGDGNGK